MTPLYSSLLYDPDLAAVAAQPLLLEDGSESGASYVRFAASPAGPARPAAAFTGREIVVGNPAWISALVGAPALGGQIVGQSAAGWGSPGRPLASPRMAVGVGIDNDAAGEPLRAMGVNVALPPSFGSRNDWTYLPARSAVLRGSPGTGFEVDVSTVDLGRNAGSDLLLTLYAGNDDEVTTSPWSATRLRGFYRPLCRKLRIVCLIGQDSPNVPEGCDAYFGGLWSTPEEAAAVAAVAGPAMVADAIGFFS